MYKYLTTKNIENYRYDISVLKNKHDMDNREKTKLETAEKVILWSKYITRAYFLAEVIRGINKGRNQTNKKIILLSFAILRLNFVWLITNMCTNLYLEKEVKSIVQRNQTKRQDLDFKKYIEHKM